MIFCQCGDQKKQSVEMTWKKIYCCSNDNCTISNNGTITCKSGKFQSLDFPCQSTCTTSLNFNTVISISTETCANEENCFEPKDKEHYFSEVCNKDENLNGRNYSDYYCGQNSEICKNNVKSKYDFKQCYATGSGDL